jgi:hypothetical protein
MTVNTFVEKVNGVKRNMSRRLMRRELRWCKVDVNFDDRKMKIHMLDMKGNRLTILRDFKENAL